MPKKQHHQPSPRDKRQQRNRDEQLIPLARAAKYFPRVRGKKLSRQTIYRYSTTGVRGVVLQTIEAGGVRCTTRAFVRQFFGELTRRKGLSKPAPIDGQADALAAQERLKAILGNRGKRTEGGASQ